MRWKKWSNLIDIKESTLDFEFKLGEEGNTAEGGNQPKGGKRVRLSRSLTPTPGYTHHTHQVQRKFTMPKFISVDMRSNRYTLEQLFYLPENADIVLREFRLGGPHVVTFLAVFVDGLVDKAIINNNLLEPLMILTNLDADQPDMKLVDWVKEALLPGNQIMELDTWDGVMQNVLAGSTVVLIEGVDKAISVETKGWEHRQVSVSQTEAVVRGPHDAFTENFRSNTGLIRARLRSPKLITKIVQVGKLARTDVAVMYLKDIANPKLVNEVLKRIGNLDVDYLPDSGMLEQLIEDPPLGVIPRFLATERPDRVTYGLTEGQVAILVGHSPYVLLAPIFLWSLLQAPEDAYLRWPFGAFIRTIRYLAMGIGLLLPAFYIAVTNFHPEMLPTELMLAIAASRERVPFPVVFEVLVMEFSLELIREAGIRIPSIIGPTIGIVGALILGQAAVAAGIISPLLIIVVSVTALGSFTIPDYNLGFSVRVLRFWYIIAASLFGFYGICLGLMVLLTHIVSLNSLGVPMLAPLSPKGRSSSDIIWRHPAFELVRRPEAYGSKNVIRLGSPRKLGLRNPKGKS